MNCVFQTVISKLQISISYIANILLEGNEMNIAFPFVILMSQDYV